VVGCRRDLHIPDCFQCVHQCSVAVASRDDEGGVFDCYISGDSSGCTGGRDCASFPFSTSRANRFETVQTPRRRAVLVLGHGYRLLANRFTTLQSTKMSAIRRTLRSVVG
jgi:hypothetical protein